MATASFFGRHGNTYIYVPNLIGGSPPRPPSASTDQLCFDAPLEALETANVSHGAAARPAGYARVVCALFAFAVAMRNPYWCITSYFIG